MNLSQIHRSFTVPLIAGIAVLVLLFVFLPKLNFEPRGIVLPAVKSTKPSASKAMFVYTVAPAKYKKLGLIRLEKSISSPSEQRSAVNEVMRKAEELARKVGANGLLIQQFFPAQSAEMRGVIINFQGLAIRVDE